MSSSALPLTRMSVKQLTRKSAPLKDMVKRSVTLFLEKHAAKFQSSLAHRFPGSLATKSQELSAEMYQGRNASRFPGSLAHKCRSRVANRFRRKIVALRPSRAVSMYLSRNAKLFKKRTV